jgi:hypothetical protein
MVRIKPGRLRWFVIDKLFCEVMEYPLLQAFVVLLFNRVASYCNPRKKVKLEGIKSNAVTSASAHH